MQIFLAVVYVNFFYGLIGAMTKNGSEYQHAVKSKQSFLAEVGVQQELSTETNPESSIKDFVVAIVEDKPGRTAVRDTPLSSNAPNGTVGNFIKN
eukprot:3914940-Alexandrium_andersonii.AAC.1